MITADSLNFDCLQLVFAYLHSKDLVSVSLVNRSFLAGVIPRLYRSLVFKMTQAKKYPVINSPFATIVAHPNLATHVRHIDIRSAPLIKSNVHPIFMQECLQAMALCKNLATFTCIPSITPSFILAFHQAESLEHIRVNANLTSEQADQLAKVASLRSLTLDHSSPQTADVLPRWSLALRATLTTLTLYSMTDLTDSVLETVLSHLPALKGLHVVGCGKVDHVAVFRAASQTPLLESLSFTGYEPPSPMPPQLTPLTHLRHLVIDTLLCLPSTPTPVLWTNVLSLTRTWSCPLASLTFRTSELLPLGDGFVKEVLDAHSATLTHIKFLNCSLSTDAVRKICTRCTDLERLAVPIPTKDTWSFADALSLSKTLHTLTDHGSRPTTHGQRAFITRPNVRLLMERVPSLRRIVSEGRVWTADNRDRWVDFGTKVSLDRRSTPTQHWFWPAESGLEERL